MGTAGPNNPCKAKRAEDEEASGSDNDNYGLDEEAFDSDSGDNRVNEEASDSDSGGYRMAEATRQALADIDKFQNELDELNEKASKEVLQVETKYNKLRKPYYDKRAAGIEKIPNFWVNAIVNHPQIDMLIDEEEEDCLHFLKKVEVEEFENLSNGFRIKFVFDENPFFDNLELVKEFELGPTIEPKSTSTTIMWKEQMDLSKKQSQIIDARRKRGLEQETFFSWFSDNKNPAADDVAEVIKDDLWPNPLQYYLTPDMDDLDCDDDDDDDDEEEGSSSEADEDEDIEDGVEVDDEHPLDEQDDEDDEGNSEDDGVVNGVAEEE